MYKAVQGFTQNFYFVMLRLKTKCNNVNGADSMKYVKQREEGVPRGLLV